MNAVILLQMALLAMVENMGATEMAFAFPIMLIGMAIPVLTIVLLILIYIKVSAIEKILRTRGLM